MKPQDLLGGGLMSGSVGSRQGPLPRESLPLPLPTGRRSSNGAGEPSTRPGSSGRARRSTLAAHETNFVWRASGVPMRRRRRRRWRL